MEPSTWQASPAMCLVERSGFGLNALLGRCCRATRTACLHSWPPNPEAGTLQQVALLFRETTPRDSDDGRYRPFATRRKAKYAAASARRTEARRIAGSSHAGEPPKDFTTCGPTSIPATDPTRANRKRVRALRGVTGRLLLTRPLNDGSAA